MQPLRSLTFVLLAATAFAQDDGLLVFTTDVWRNPIANARVYEGGAPASEDSPLAYAREDGRCTVPVPAGTLITVDHEDYAPLVLPIEASDIERGYVTAILYEGGAIQANFRVGGSPVESDYILLRYADPMIYGGILQSRTSANGGVRFSHIPEGLAYLTGGAEVGGALRTTTIPIQVRNEATNYLQLTILTGSAAVYGAVYGPDGEPARSTLSGTFIYGRRIEELRAETGESGEFDLTHLPDAPLVLRATLDSGLMKRVDIHLSDEEVEQDIRFDAGATLTVSLEDVASFERADVFVLDDALAIGRIRDPSDRATYIRSARAARLGADKSNVTLHGIPAGDYTAIALITVYDDGLHTSRVSEFKKISVAGESHDIPLRFRGTE